MNQTMLQPVHLLQFQHPPETFLPRGLNHQFLPSRVKLYPFNGLLKIWDKRLWLSMLKFGFLQIESWEVETSAYHNHEFHHS